MKDFEAGDTICWRQGKTIMSGGVLGSSTRSGVLGFTVRIIRKDGTFGVVRHVPETKNPFRWNPFIRGSRRSVVSPGTVEHFRQLTERP